MRPSFPLAARATTERGVGAEDAAIDLLHHVPICLDEARPGLHVELVVQRAEQGKARALKEGALPEYMGR